MEPLAMPAELLERLRRSLPSTARLQRLGMQAAANQALQQVAEDLIRLTADPRVEARLGPHLAELLQAQERGDVLCMADFLEHVLLPEIENEA